MNVIIVLKEFEKLWWNKDYLKIVRFWILLFLCLMILKFKYLKMFDC